MLLQAQIPPGQQLVNNPWFNPGLPVSPINMPQVPTSMFDPRFFAPMGLQDPMLLQRTPHPRPDWVEMILFYRDGSSYRTIRDPFSMVKYHFKLCPSDIQ